MERTFETPGGVRLYVDNPVGLVAITADTFKFGSPKTITCDRVAPTLSGAHGI